VLLGNLGGRKPVDKSPAPTAEKGISTKLVITETLLLAAAPLGGYLVAFAYEFGYAKHFGVPLYLVSVGLSQVFIAIGALLFLAWILFVCFDTAYMVIRPERLRDVWRIRLARAPVYLVLATAAIWLGVRRWAEWVGFLFVLGMIVFYELVFPLLTQRGVKGYEAKLQAQDVLDHSVRSLFDGVRRRLGPTALKLILWSGIAIYLAYLLGKAEGVRQTVFYVHSNPADTVLIRVYGDVAVSARLANGGRSLSGVYLVQRIPEGSTLQLERKELGTITWKTK
jgi:hypothetical protein